MKKALLGLVLIALTYSVSAQTKPAAKKPAASSKKPASTAQQGVIMKNALDSFSYALGLSMAAFYKEQGIKDINTACVTKALKDVNSGKALMDEGQVNAAIVSYMQSIKSASAAPYRKEGQAFLDSNKAQKGVVVLPSGLQYRVIKEGTGPKPAATDKVKVHYHGTLING